MMPVGSHTYFAGQVSLKHGFPDADLVIGRYCSIGEGLVIMPSKGHRTDWISTYPFKEMKGLKVPNNTVLEKVTLGNDVWIGDYVTIMSGVYIGDGAVVGAASVVSKDVPDYAVVAGNPAEFRKFRFKASEIEQLIQLAWWNWSDEKVRRAAPLLMSGDVKALVEWAKRS